MHPKITLIKIAYYKFADFLTKGKFSGKRLKAGELCVSEFSSKSKKTLLVCQTKEVFAEQKEQHPNPFESSDVCVMVEISGFEPLACYMRSNRSAN